MDVPPSQAQRPVSSNASAASPPQSKEKQQQREAAKATSPKRVIVIGMTTDLYSQNALEYYAEEIHREGDFVVVVYCHKSVDEKGLAEKQVSKVSQQEASRVETTRKMLEDRLKKLKLRGEVQTCLEGDPTTRLTEVAEAKKARLIVIGSRNLGPELRELLHSHSTSIVEKSNIPILVWKPGGFE